MASVPEPVRSWLYSVLVNEYSDATRTYADVFQTLSYYQTLSPRTDVYTYENGQSVLLLHLAGTLPVNFRGTAYRFPVSIWVPKLYPVEGPMVFVTPTRDMAIRPGQHVSSEGRIYHPYLTAWEPNKSSIGRFLGELGAAFEREPPVISKQQRPPPPQQNDTTPPPRPPLPPELGRSSLGTTQNGPKSSPANGPPPLPPKPSEERAQSQNLIDNRAPPLPPHPGRLSGMYIAPEETYQNGYVQTPRTTQQVVQQTPQRSSSLRDGYIQSSGNQFTTQSGIENQRWRQDGPSSVSPNPPQSRLPPAHGQSQHQQKYQGPPPPALPGGPGPPSQETPHQPFNQAPQYQTPRRPFQPSLSQPPQPSSKPPPPADLLSSPFDTPLPTETPSLPAPPIPPSPEKDALLSSLSRTLTTHLHSTIASHASALPALRAQNAALQQTLQSLHAEHHALTNLQSLLSSNEQILHSAMRSADKVIADATDSNRPVPSVDEVLVAPHVVGEQLYDLVAGERACVEGRAVLNRALDRGRVGVDVWVRSTRALAREEFLKKVLIRKISRGLGLEG